VSAFVAAGFEHSIANMYFIPMGLMIKTFGDAGATADAITWFGFLSNLVGLVYHIIYRHKPGHV
jgi:formate transporter